MKRRTLKMIMIVVACALGSTAVEAQSPDTSPPPAAVPAMTPDIDTPVSPSAPVHPGEMPPMASPDALPPPAPLQQVEGMPAYPVWMSRAGAAMMLGGGYEDFTYANIRAMTGAGGTWDARLVAGNRQVVGFEAAYVGAARSIQTLGLASDTNLISNGVEGTLRIDVPIIQGATLVEPFGFVGLGWQHYSLTKTPATSDLTGSDDVMTLPYGAGLEASYRRFLVDARMTYRQTYRNDLLRVDGGRLNTWGLNGNVGVEF